MFAPRQHRMVAFVCGLTVLLASTGRVQAQYTATGLTYLNVYFFDGNATYGSTASPYNPQECDHVSPISPTPPGGVGMKLHDYGPAFPYW